MKTLKQQVDQAVATIAAGRPEKVQKFIRNVLTAGVFTCIEWTTDVAENALSDEEMKRQIDEIAPKQ